MAFPTNPDGTRKELEIDLNPDEMTVGDVRLSKGDVHLHPDDPGAVAALVVQLAGFLMRHTKWSEQEVNNLKLLELVEVGEMVRSRERAASVPLASNGSSARGQGETATMLPDGSTTSSTPSSSDVTPST